MLLIKNAKVLTMAGTDYERGDILVDGGKIVKVGENIQADGAEIVDAEGKWALPGFIDAHCHVGIYEESMRMEGADGNEMTNPVTPNMHAIDAINPVDIAFQEALQAGITTACTGPGSANVIGGTFVAMKTLGNRVDDMVFKNPLALKTAFGENPKRVYGEKKVSPFTRMGTAAVMRDAWNDAKNYKRKKELGKDDPTKMPDYDEKKEILVKALDGELLVKAHAHRADDILTAIRIMKEFGIRYTIEHCTEGYMIADTLKEENASIIIGPLFSNRSKVELKNLSFDAPRVLWEHGVKFAMMTDHPVIPLMYLPVCCSLAVRSGLPEDVALKSITIWAAEIAGIADRVGSLEPGKDADITLFEGNPLDVRTRVSRVFVEGKCAYDSGR